MMREGQKKSGIPVWIYGLAGVLLMVIGYRLMNPARAAAAHPDPRAGVTSAKVLAAGQFVQQPDIARVYAMARDVPEVLDGIYCHCDCHKHSQHRSLLTCFETDHGSMCDICMGEAALAHKLAKAGKSLQEIRAAIDAQFG